MAQDMAGRWLAAGFLGGLVAVGGVGVVRHAIDASDLPAAVTLPPRPARIAARGVAPRLLERGAEAAPATRDVRSLDASEARSRRKSEPTVLVASPPADAPHVEGAEPDAAGDRPGAFPADAVEVLPLDRPAASLPPAAMLPVTSGILLVQYQATADEADGHRGEGAAELATERRAPRGGEMGPDADALEWTDGGVGGVPQLDAADGQRRGPVAQWIRDSFEDMRTSRGGVVAFPQRQAAVGGGRLLDRIRSGDRLLGRDRTDGKGARAEHAAAHGWPPSPTLLSGLEHLAKAEPASSAAWAGETGLAVRQVLATGGPGDASAAAALEALAGKVAEGFTLAASTKDPIQAAALRRVVLATQRRQVVWQAARTLLAGDGEESMQGTPLAEASPIEGLSRIVPSLLETLERHEAAANPSDASRAGAILASLDGGGPAAAAFVEAVRGQYAAANVRVAVHQKFVELILPPTRVTSAPVEDTVLGRQVRGSSRVAQSTAVRFKPDDDGISVLLEVRGQVASRTITESGPVALTSRGTSSFTVRKPVTVGEAGLVLGKAVGSASARSQLADIQTNFDGVPIMRSLVRTIARNQHDENLPEANREVTEKIVSRACREVDQQVEPKLVEAAERIRTQAWGPLVRLGLDPTPVALETTDGIAMARLRLAAPDQLAAFTPRPRAPLGSMVSVQVHESAVNNALDRLGVAGRRLALEDLVALLGERIGIEASPPEDLPEDVTVQFAETQPLQVRYRDGLVHVRVALDALESGRRAWHDIVASVTYRPKAQAPQVFLEREGPVHIGGPGRQGRAEIALRAVFGKIFPKERPVALVPESAVADPKMAGLDVLQAVVSDGWLAISIGEGVEQSRPAPAPKVAAPAAPRRGLRR